jgi:hypothetical protein
VTERVRVVQGEASDPPTGGVLASDRRWPPGGRPSYPLVSGLAKPKQPRDAIWVV